MSKPTITIYSTQWCGDCFRAKRFLEEREVDFVEVDIESDEQAALLVMRENEGKRRVPTFLVDDRFYGNPRLDELARILNVDL